MRFAKLEQNLIIAFFLAYFPNVQVSDARGNRTSHVPPVNRNNHTAKKPDQNVYIKYSAKA